MCRNASNIFISGVVGLILKQDKPEPNRLKKFESPFILLRAFTAKGLVAIQIFFCAI